MLVLFISALLFTMQTPQVDGFKTSDRNRKMTYGKSKAAFQPFICKPGNPGDSDRGNSRKNVQTTAGEIASTSPADDGINRLKVFDITKSDLNPIQVLEKLNRDRKVNLAPKPVSLHPTLSEFESMGLAETSTSAVSSSQQQNPEQQQQPQQQQQQQQQSAPTQKSWQRPKSSSGLANIYWRSVDVDDLRTHPYFNR